MKLRFKFRPRTTKRFKKKHKKVSEAMEYEKIPPDRSRNRFISKKDRGIEFDIYTGVRSVRLILDRKLRQGYKIFKLATRKVIERIHDAK